MMLTYVNSLFLGMVFVAMAFQSCKTGSGKAAWQADTTCTRVMTNAAAQGYSISMEFIKGPYHNHPLMVLWVEDKGGNYIQTLFITQSIASGTFAFGRTVNGEWQEGPRRHPAALPYWGHKRGVIADDGLYLPTPEDPMPDAITGATPKGSYLLETHTDSRELNEFRLLLEINQTWDWNDYWSNNRFPDNDEYKKSCQPALVYAVDIDMSSPLEEYTFVPVGHSHYSGKDGSLTRDISTLSTALNIAHKITARVK